MLQKKLCKFKCFFVVKNKFKESFKDFWYTKLNQTRIWDDEYATHTSINLIRQTKSKCKIYIIWKHYNYFTDSPSYSASYLDKLLIFYSLLLTKLFGATQLNDFGYILKSNNHSDKKIIVIIVLWFGGINRKYPVLIDHESILKSLKWSL